jgi:iron complex outermembrane receptor protein
MTPRHAAMVTAMWENEAFGKLGIEASYTGHQSLNNRVNQNPFRKTGADYVLLGALAEWNVTEELTLFINVDNLTDVRQSRFDPLIRPSQAPDGRWTVDAWAPLDGRTINGGLRARI